MTNTYKANSLNPAETVKRKPGRPPAKPVMDLRDFDFTEKDLEKGLADPLWRMSHLYKIVDADSKVVVFKPNQAQRHLIENLHNRNLILKARKMGFSTFIQIYMLDTAIFSPNVRGVVIAQDRDIAEAIFRDVLKFAYDSLPEPLKNAVLLETTPSKSTIIFSNKLGNSLVEVRTSSRGTTPTFLHISEFGKISAKDPGKAKEIVTGSITAVAENGLVFVESTAEGGEEGEFGKFVEMARKLQDAGKVLWKLDFKFHFFGWWRDKRYRAPANSVVIPLRDVEYFNDLEEEIGEPITPEQRAWYVKYRDVTYHGDQEMMWQEMPGTPEEAFKVSMEGAYFREQFRQIRKDQRIGLCPYDSMFPVSTFWDIGGGSLKGDETAIWLFQARRTYYAIIGYVESTGEPYSYYVSELDRLGYVWDYHYLPHDANHRRQGAEHNLTPEDMIRSVAPTHWRFELVPRTPDKIISIQQARILLGQCVFDEAACALGLKRLETYRKEWNPRSGTWKGTPHHGPESNGADAFLQAAQAKANGQFSVIGNLSRQNGGFGAEDVVEPVLGF